MGIFSFPSGKIRDGPKFLSRTCLMRIIVFQHET